MNQSFGGAAEREPRVPRDQIYGFEFDAFERKAVAAAARSTESP